MDEEGDNTLSHGVERMIRRGPTPARLSVVYPFDLVKTIVLTGDSVTLGRHSGGDHALRHPTVSRAHLELAWDPALGAYTVRDLGSHNGSSLDGVRLGPVAQRVPHNAAVRLGDVLAVFELLPPEAASDPLADAVDRDAIPGEAVATRLLRGRIVRAAADPSPALLVGETGTGKERMAAELHRLSGRPGPLVAVNCAALSAHLVESQLLGHVRGAFTGAQGDQPGLIRSAAGGTMFFDEVGELPLDLQPKLLRVVQEKEVLPVGGARAVKVDVRIVAASNRDLARLVDEGGFRRDLYARLAMWEIRVPAIRERRADLFTWLQRLSVRLRSERGLPPASLKITAEAAERLLLCDFYDNLRGLDRLLHELGDGDTLSSLPRWLDEKRSEAAPAPQPPAAHAKIPAPTREALVEAFERLGRSVRATAKHFGRDRRQIYRWLEAYGMRGEEESLDKDE